MTILHRLASALHRRDEVPNQELARHIAETRDHESVTELVVNLKNKSKDIQHDCIKALYEIGAIDASLIAGHTPVFIDLLLSKNNRLQWGAMTALQTIAVKNPEQVHRELPKIMAAAEKGSVITKDEAVKILVQLASHPDYKETAFPLLNELVQKSPPNQVPMYAELAIPILNVSNKDIFIKTLNARMHDIDKESKRKRVEKVIKKANTLKTLFTGFFLMSLLIACQQNANPTLTEEGGNKQSLAQKQKNELVDNMDGEWISEPYIRNIEKTRSVFQNQEYETELWGFQLDGDKLLSEAPSMNGYSDHEGGLGGSLRYDSSRNIFVNGFISLENTTGFKDSFDLHFVEEGILEMYFPSTGRRDRYRKVTDAQTELRRVLFEGSYTGKGSVVIDFKSDGSLSNFGTAKYYDVVYDFFEGINYDAIILYNSTEANKFKDGDLYTYKISGDTLALQYVKTNWNTMNHVISDNKIILVRK